MIYHYRYYAALLLCICFISCLLLLYGCWLTLFNSELPVSNERNTYIPTVMTYSSKAGADADFKLVNVYVWRRQTDWKNGVGVGDRTGQLQQSNVSNDCIGIVLRMRKHSRHARQGCARFRIRALNSPQTHLQLWRWSCISVQTHHNTTYYSMLLLLGP